MILGGYEHGDSLRIDFDCCYNGPVLVGAGAEPLNRNEGRPRGAAFRFAASRQKMVAIYSFVCYNTPDAGFVYR